MAEPGIGPLRVHSDLRLVVGGLSADIVADGRRISLHTDDPARLFAEAAAASPARSAAGPTLRAMIGRAGRLLTEVGLSAQLDGGRGVVIELGHGCESRLGRVLVGSDNVRLGRAGAVLPAAVGYVLAAARRRTSYVLAGVALAVLVGSARTPGGNR